MQYGLNCKRWTNERDYIVSANAFVLNSKMQHSNIVIHCTTLKNCLKKN
jgi:hypothetical protein